MTRFIRWGTWTCSCVGAVVGEKDVIGDIVGLVVDGRVVLGVLVGL